MPSQVISVVGIYTGPDHTGITVNGKAAYAQSGVFLAPDVGIDAASPSLQVVATTLDGLTSNTAVTVLLPSQAPLVSLLSNAGSGLAPFNMDFQLSTDPSVTVQNIAIDFEGDGTTDYTTTDASAIPSHDYNSAGVYRPNVTVTCSRAYARWIGPPVWSMRWR